MNCAITSRREVKLVHPIIGLHRQKGNAFKKLGTLHDERRPTSKSLLELLHDMRFVLNGCVPTDCVLTPRRRTSCGVRPIDGVGLCI